MTGKMREALLERIKFVNDRRTEVARRLFVERTKHRALVDDVNRLAPDGRPFSPAADAAEQRAIEKQMEVAALRREFVSLCEEAQEMQQARYILDGDKQKGEWI